jgi:hypothetical protein
MLAYVGLSRPYRFERAIIAFVAFVLAIAVLLAAGWLVAVGELTAFGPRAFYFLYLLALLVLVIALVRWPRLAGARDPTPGELATRNVVATLGGSTTYDIGAGETPGATGSPPPSSRVKARGASSSSITACRATPPSNT